MISHASCLNSKLQIPVLSREKFDVSVIYHNKMAEITVGSVGLGLAITHFFPKLER
jgi:hypothetical protein